MKHIIAAMIVGLMSSNVFADQEVVLDMRMKTEEYTASVVGKNGCKMPVDLSNVKTGECEVKKSKFETGWKLVKVGSICYDQHTSLIEMKKFKSAGIEIEAPITESRRNVVACPT